LISALLACDDAVVPADQPRLLHRHSQYGYTDRPERALYREPEAVSVEAQEQLTLSARRAEHAQQVEQWRERRAAIAREVAWLYSQRFRRDVGSSVRALERQLERLDQRIAS
jgi:hypothetical protein